MSIILRALTFLLAMLPLVGPGAALGAASPPSAPANADAIDPVPLRAFVDGFVRSAMRREHIAGVAVAIVQNGRPLLLRGYGYSRFGPARPVDPRRTLFRIGSVSKTFTWVALMRAVERGEINLSAPVNAYLPDRLKIPNEGFKRPVRVIDLMSHAPGFEDHDVGSLFARPQHLMRLDDYLATYRPARVREPGILSTYSNYGVALAGAIVARRAGADFDTLAERAIFQPLGMSRTSFREPHPARGDLPRAMPATLAKGISDGFSWSGGGFRPHPFEHVLPRPAGSVSTTAADMARYMAMLLQDGQLDGATIFGSRAAAAFRTPIMRTPGTVNGWAYGFMISTLPGRYRGYGHSGSTQWMLSNMVVIPQLKLGVFITANTNTAGALVNSLASEIVTHFYAPAGPPPPPSAELGGKAERYTGTYLSTRRAYSGLQRALALFTATAKVFVSEEGYLVTQKGSEISRWAPTGEPGRFMSVGTADVLSFRLDREGRAVSWQQISGTQTFQRLSPWATGDMLLIVGALAGIVSAGVLIGFFVRKTQKVPRSPWQERSERARLVATGCWIAAFATFGIWLLIDSGTESRIYDWPAPWLLSASLLAIVASIATIAIFIIFVFSREKSAVDLPTWSFIARLRFAVTLIVYVLFASLLATSGALAPWA